MSKRGVSPNKSNQIYCTVREDIINGVYPGGTFITEGALCEQFDVSRTPVREALIRLAQDRFVELIPNKGAIVPHVDIKDIVELYQLRMVNEGLAAALVADSRSDALLQKLETSILREEELIAQGEEPLTISTEDFVFHNLIVRNCGNRRLVEVLELIDNQMHRFARAAADSLAIETLTCSAGHHRRALEAIRAGDREAARSVISDHWQDMLNGYVRRGLAGTLPIQL